MPSNAADVSGLDIVLGDRYGASAAPPSWTFWNRAQALGLCVRRNKPFAGGYITEHFGSPADGVHAVQIEIARALYLDERRIVRTERWPALQQDLFAAAKALALELGGNPEVGRLAAE